ncbi:MAG: hypothetical protein KAJ49_00150 [Arcobacteraceae bacterium]|nr:hypothetical protein [Arcobacteraceae bacterium]
MSELVLSKDELVKLFIKEEIEDTQDGWLYQGNILVNIIAIHDQDPKYVYNVTNAEYYKITPIEQI